MRDNYAVGPGSSPAKAMTGGPARAEPRPAHLRRAVSLTLALVVFWLILSGKFDVGHVMTGVACAVLTTLAIAPLWRLRPAIEHSAIPPFGGVPWWRFLTYLPWLGWQIVLANVHVARVVLSPQLPIGPRLVRLRMPVAHLYARLTLANSITLTPGTVTVDVDGDEFLVHCLTPAAAQALYDHHIARRVESVFATPGAAAGEGGET